jgi:hypothetical protein
MIYRYTEISGQARDKQINKTLNTARFMQKYSGVTRNQHTRWMSFPAKTETDLNKRFS